MDYVTAQLHIDYGRGMAGQKIGVPENVYRLQANAAVNYLDAANLVARDLRVGRRMLSTKGIPGPDQMHSIFYELLFDAGIPSMGAYHFEVGDVFVDDDPYYGVGATETEFSTDQFEAFCLAYHGPPMRKAIGVRIDRVAKIYRPATASTSDATGPYFNETVSGEAELPLVLASGGFSFGSAGATAAGVPVGVSTFSRTFREEFRGIPNSTDINHFFFYVPPLPGVNLREGDRILIDGVSTSLATAGRYVVHGPWAQYAGLSGYQLVCKRMVGNT